MGKQEAQSKAAAKCTALAVIPEPLGLTNTDSCAAAVDGGLPSVGEEVDVSIDNDTLKLSDRNFLPSAM